MKIINRWYFQGVAVGLIISWATGALAYRHVGLSIFPTIIEFEFVVSIIMIAVAFLLGNKK